MTHAHFLRFAVSAAVATSLVAANAWSQYPYLLKDIEPGGSSIDGQFEDWNGRAVWPARTSIHGKELWISDGTSAGTHVLLDINPGPADSVANFMGSVELNGWHYFTADDGVNGRELWRSDGTAGGTTLFFEFEPGPSSSSPTALTFGGLLYLFPTTSAEGREPWISDGTVAGTQILKDVWPGPTSGTSSNHSGTTSNHGAMSEALGRLWFPANDGVHGMEIWTTDGTPAGTQMFADLHPAGFANPPTRPFEITPSLGLLTVYQTATGNELWRTDGTPLGTTMVLDLAPGPASGTFVIIGPLANGALLAGITANQGREPWFTDGTAAGTFQLADLNPGNADGMDWLRTRILSPTRAVGMGESPATGREVWATDGTVAGTGFIELNPGPAGGVNDSFITVTNGRLFFYGAEPATSLEIAVSDGSVAGTYVVRDLTPGNPFLIHVMYKCGNGVLGGVNNTIAYSDGLAQHTAQLSSAPGQGFNLWIYRLALIGNHIFMYVFDPQNGYEPYAIEVDGDRDGTIEFFDDLNVARECLCDASVAPCGNSDPNAGCANSTGLGARLDGSGTTQLAADDLVLTLSQLPPSASGLMFMGANALNSTPFFAGVRCVASPIARWPLANSGAVGTFSYGPGLAAQAATLPAPFQFAAGSTWRFQGWYRNSAGPCGETTNLSNSATVVFTP